MNLISLYFAKINHRPLRLCCAVLCCVVWCYSMLCYVMLCYVTLCYVMLCFVILYSTLKHLASRCRWTSSRVCRSRSLVIRCESQLSLVRLSASVFTLKVLFDLFVNVLMFLVVRFLCYFSSWCVNYTKTNMAESWVAKLFHTLLRNAVLLDFKRSWKIEMRCD